MEKKLTANRIYIKAHAFYSTGVYFLTILAVEYGLTFLLFWLSIHQWIAIFARSDWLR